MLGLSIRNVFSLTVAGALTLFGARAARAQWSDNFDSYAAGSTITGQGGWAGWNLSAVNADVTNEEAASAPNSLRLRPDSDVVRLYQGFAGGVWLIKAKVFIPSNHTGQTWFIVLNQYAHNGTQNWSTQIIFENGNVASSGGTGFGGGGAALGVVDEWADIEIEVDLDLNLQVIRYEGQVLDETPWQASGLNEIQCIDLYSAAGSAAYFDDLSIEEIDVGVRPSRTITLTGSCPDPNPLAVRVTQPVPAGANGADQVTVTETVVGPISAADVTASNGGVVSALEPTGTRRVGGSTFVLAWNHLGPYQGVGGAPGDAIMRQDFLIGDNSEEDYAFGDVPASGEEDTLFGVAASTGIAPTTNPAINPSGVPEWFPSLTNNDTQDFNGGPYYGEDLNQVMVYSVSYVTLADDADNVNLCIGSDDGVQVLLDGEEVHINSIARAYGVAGECQDTVPIGPLDAGEHVVMVKTFEEGGGHGFRLGFQNADTLGPLEGVTACTTQGQAPCDFGPVGVEIVWTVARSTVASGVSYSIDSDSGAFSFSGDVAGIRTIGDRSTNVCLEPTTSAGQIREFLWAGLGAFTHPFGCGGAAQSLLGNHISPARIDCAYPSIGEEIEYDANAAVSTGYTGPRGPGGGPVWRAVNDGTDNGLIDLDAALGSQDFVMAWLVTYVDNVSGGPLDVLLCFGSDDNGQIWVDDELVHNNSICRGTSGCNDTVGPITLSEGPHAIKMAAWDNDGGWVATLAIQDDAGTPLRGDEGLIEYLGPDRPAGFVVPECGGCDLLPVTDLTCEFGRVGLGTGLVLSWTNPPDIDPLTPTRIEVNGVQVATVASNAETVGIPDAQLPDGIYVVSVIHCGGVPASCTPFKTDAQGLITGESWLVVGPFANPFACNGIDDDLLGNHIAPSYIGCLYPEEDDEVDYDAGDPENVSTGYVGPTGGGGLPLVTTFDDGSATDGDVDLDLHYGNQTDVMAWAVTYVENQSGGDLPVNLCFGSDDGGQVWFNDRLVHNNNAGACRARGVCQDVVPVTLPDGHVRIAVGNWENDGGWGFSLGLQDEFGTAILDDGALDIIFHGTTRPVAEDQYPCSDPQAPVTNLSCVKNAQGGVNLSWTNPALAESPIRITVNGVEVDTLAANAQSYTVAAGDLGDTGVAKICLDNGSFEPVCCGVASSDELYINCGGAELTDTAGRVWTADTLANPSGFLTSANANTAAPAAPTDLLSDPKVADEEYPPGVFSAERWADGPVEYTINGLPPGSYEVTLLFMEHCCNDAGCNPADPLASAACRVFNISVNGNLIEENFSQVVRASELTGNMPNTESYFVALAVVAANVQPVGGAITIRLDDLGAGNPPENAAIKGIAIVPSGGPGVVFKRGDADAVGPINITDGVFLLNFLFLGGPQPPCMDAADVNDGGTPNITTAVFLFNFLFLGGPQPPAPGPARCGVDPSGDPLDCDSYNNC